MAFCCYCLGNQVLFRFVLSVVSWFGFGVFLFVSLMTTALCEFTLKKSNIGTIHSEV